MKRADDDKGGQKGKGKKVEKEDEISTQAPARVVIKAPADVRITFNGQATTRRSTEETFLTPDLEPGRTYAYRVTASVVREGKPVTRNERVVVRAGKRSVVDFTDLGEATASAKGDPARVTVLLPAGARLYVDGQAYGSSARQTFATPRLDKRKVYYYTLQAEKPAGDRSQNDVRRVNVEAGKSVTVDFRSRSVASRWTSFETPRRTS